MKLEFMEEVISEGFVLDNFLLEIWQEGKLEETICSKEFGETSPFAFKIYGTKEELEEVSKMFNLVLSKEN